MDEFLRRLSANNFAEIEGLQVTGTLPVRQDIVNELITGLVRDAQAVAPAAPATPSGTSAEQVNWWKLVNKLQVLLKDGRVFITGAIRQDFPSIPAEIYDPATESFSTSVQASDSMRPRDASSCEKALASASIN